MKYAAIAILALGVAICAALGARLSPALYDQTVVEGRAAMLSERVDEAHTAYCDARAEAELPVADGCPEPEPSEEEAAAAADAEATDEAAEDAAAEDAPGDEEEAAEEEPAPDADAILAELTEALAAERASADSLPDELSALRDDWYEARAAVLPDTAIMQAAPVLSPGERMKGWLGHSGAFFGAGLLLVVAGSVLGRRAAKLEASSEGPTSGSGSVSVDVPGFLEDAASRAAALADEFAQAEALDAAGWEHFKSGVTALIVERIEPLTESGPRMQARYGMAAFAAVFSPLSSGERRLNRAWSAMTDHHAPEALDSLRQAAEQLDAARSELKKHAS